MQQLTKQ